MWIAPDLCTTLVYVHNPEYKEWKATERAEGVPEFLLFNYLACTFPHGHNFT